MPKLQNELRSRRGIMGHCIFYCALYHSHGGNKRCAVVRITPAKLNFFSGLQKIWRGVAPVGIDGNHRPRACAAANFRQHCYLRLAILRAEEDGCCRADFPIIEYNILLL